MGLLKRLVGLGYRRADLPTRTAPPPVPRFSSDRPPGHAHRLLLGEFVDCGDFDNQVEAFWSGALGECPHDAIRSFRALGWLVPTPLARKMEMVWDEGSLWRIARERFLPAYGSKAALIERLIEADPVGVARQLGYQSWFTCSPEGAKWALEPLMRTGTRYYSSGCIEYSTPTPTGDYSEARRIRMLGATQGQQLFG